MARQKRGKESRGGTARFPGKAPNKRREGLPMMPTVQQAQAALREAEARNPGA